MADRCLKTDCAALNSDPEKVGVRPPGTLGLGSRPWTAAQLDPARDPAPDEPEQERLADPGSLGLVGWIPDLGRLPIHCSVASASGRPSAIAAIQDPSEVEARMVADRVMTMSDPSGPQGPRQPVDRAAVASTDDRRPGMLSMAPVRAPPQVVAALRSPGSPIPASTRGFMERRFGYDFSQVRVHDDPVAAGSARAVNATAYTLGCDIVMAAGRYEPDTGEGRRLLAHELAHVVQHQSSPTPMLNRTEDEPASRVFIIGSPGPAEIRAGHPYQFALAAVGAGGTGEGCVWFVERTGYEAGGVDLAHLEDLAQGAEIRWIHEFNDVIQEVNGFAPGTITELRIFSHGLPGQVTLRYGWQERGMPNYGISIEQVQGARPDAFAPGAEVSVESCNSATSDFGSSEGNLAQELAEHTQQDVEGWSGRTSYAEVNEPGGTDDVVASQVVRGSHVDWTEMGSRFFFGREPERRTYSPARGPRIGGFQSSFEITNRLPETRTFSVMEGGTVVVRCPDANFVLAEGDLPEEPLEGEFHVLLHRERLGPDASLEMNTFPVHPNDVSAVYSNLVEGTYYLEIFTPGALTSEFPIRSTIMVDVYGP